MSDPEKNNDSIESSPPLEDTGEHIDSLRSYMRQLSTMPEFSYEEQSHALKNAADALEKLRGLLVQLGFVQIEYLNILADCNKSNIFDYFIPSIFKKNKDSTLFIEQLVPKWQHEISEIHKDYVARFKNKQSIADRIPETIEKFGSYPVVADLLQKWYDTAKGFYNDLCKEENKQAVAFIEKKLLMEKNAFIDFFENSLEAAYTELNKVKDTILESNLRLVIGLARSFNSRGMQLNDLIQEGNLGLIRAIEKFDYHLGHKFSTYASWWIKQTIGRAISEQSRIIRIPVHMIQTISKINKTEQRLIQLNGKEPEIEALAAETGLTRAKVSAIKKMARQSISLQAPVRSEDGTSSLEDFLCSNDNNPISPIAERTVREKLYEAIATLSEREQTILQMRFGLNDQPPKTLVEVSKHFNLTRERIRQLEQRIFEKLRSPARLKFFDGHFHID